MPIETGITYRNESACPAATATASTSNISSVAYAVDDKASDENTANATFFVRRSCTACSVRSALPTSKRLNRAKKLIDEVGRRRDSPKEITRAVVGTRLVVEDQLTPTSAGHGTQSDAIAEGIKNL